MKQTTSKKSKFVGVKILIDPKTNEEYPMQMNQIEDRDFNFHKLWLKNFIYGIRHLSNQRLEVAFWIIEHLDENNILIATQRKIAKETGISLNTVSIAMTTLQAEEPPFLIQIQQGVYKVNPDIIFKGSHAKRMGVCFEYKEPKTRKKGQLLQEETDQNA